MFPPLSSEFLTLIRRQDGIAPPSRMPGAVGLYNDDYPAPLIQQETQAVATTAPLAIVQANNGSTVRFQIISGTIGGFLADSGMSPGPFYVTPTNAAGTYHFYAAMTQRYDNRIGLWTCTASTGISSGTSVPADTATTAYVEIGNVTLTSTGGGFSVTITQILSGNQGIGRAGSAGSYGTQTWLV